MLRPITTNATTGQILMLIVGSSVSSWFAMNYTKQMHIDDGYRKRDRELYEMQIAQMRFYRKDSSTTSTAEATASQEKSV